MKKSILILLFTCAAFLVSCTTRTYEEISEAEAATAPSYTNNVAPVIQSNCLGCHADGGQYPTLQTYEQVKDATQNGDLICRIDQTQSCGSVMPRSGAMPRQTIDMIILWQKEGYKN
ncbi:hypothetical protein DMB65_20170 [Flavobacterium cheongpyeongense]|jgi:hypothetical protein|uniref:Cytochrome c domain-containing protein n=1 Tax=Flavobacterium cheongpyeongense TaxID=2212651 RepID=A0A2V4BJ36_9FLAO|nr:hypothetical protein [Flavobacterium cheongpyeongense]PXY38976.1 hypothetical protein DMB65_20170 [Flavobacterium cheongpyeongense]